MVVIHPLPLSHVVAQSDALERGENEDDSSESFKVSSRHSSYGIVDR